MLHFAGPTLNDNATGIEEVDRDSCTSVRDNHLAAMLYISLICYTPISFPEEAFQSLNMPTNPIRHVLSSVGVF
jgi:hypothetical protein